MKFYYITVTKKLFFLIHFLFSILFERTKINDDLQQYDTNPTFSNFFFSKIFFILIFITCHQKKLERPRFRGVGCFASFYKNIELVAILDECHWNYAIDEYCNYTIKIKDEFYSEKNYSWCYSNVIKTFEKVP